MLYGFLGFQPTAEGCRIEPRLPQAWPSLTITRIHLHDQVVAITADAATKTITLAGTTRDNSPQVAGPSGWKVIWSPAR